MMEDKEKRKVDVFDISSEVALMREIKDIKDELSILRNLLNQQTYVTNRYSMALDDSRGLKKAMQRLRDTVEEMDTYADRPYKAVSGNSP